MTGSQNLVDNPIEGKVATILNERELAINIGSSSGVKNGMKFKILSDQPTEIRDPDTDEIIGVVDREKVRVMVTEVQDRLSICKTFRKRYVGGPYSSFGSMILAQDLFTPRKEVLETLKAEDSSLPPPLSEDESYVRKGDRVIQILSDDEH